MRNSKTTLSVLLGLALAFSASHSSATDGDGSAGRVSVGMVNPEQFSEIRHNRSRGDLRDGTWLERLQTHVVKTADRRLPAGETLDVRITDIKRAGDFEPWRGPQFDDVRIVKDIYPPRIALSYTLKAADGAVIGEGDEVLRDPGFLSRGLRVQDDPLRYEKRLLDDWLAKLLPSSKS